LVIQLVFLASWRVSIKEFVGLSPSTPLKILGHIFEDPMITADTMNDKNLAKVNNRFGTEYEVQELTLESLKSLRHVPNNFTRIFSLAKEVCTCHHHHLTLETILRHKEIPLGHFHS
jgi:hypothetical protein